MSTVQSHVVVNDRLYNVNQRFYIIESKEG